MTNYVGPQTSNPTSTTFTPTDAPPDTSGGWAEMSALATKLFAVPKDEADRIHKGHHD
jgi:hypothetical protein